MISTTIQTMRVVLAITRDISLNFPGKPDTGMWELPALWAKL